MLLMHLYILLIITCVAHVWTFGVNAENVFDKKNNYVQIFCINLQIYIAYLLLTNFSLL